MLIAGLVTALLTAAYATRLWLLAFPVGRAAQAAQAAGPLAAEPGAPYSPEADEVDPGQREPAAMRWPLWVLAVPSIGFGVAGLRTDWLPALLDGGSLRPSVVTAVLGTGLAVAGVLVSYAAWRTAAAKAGTEPAAPLADPGRELLGPLHGPAQHGFHLDRLYSLLFVRPTVAAAELVKFLDREVIEGYVQGSGGAAKLLGWVVRRSQTGNAQTYLSALLAGAVLIAVFVAVGT